MQKNELSSGVVLRGKSSAGLLPRLETWRANIVASSTNGYVTWTYTICTQPTTITLRKIVSCCCARHVTNLYTQSIVVRSLQTSDCLVAVTRTWVSRQVLTNGYTIFARSHLHIAKAYARPYHVMRYVLYSIHYFRIMPSYLSIACTYDDGVVCGAYFHWL